jgi:hypothetical protein
LYVSKNKKSTFFKEMDKKGVGGWVGGIWRMLLISQPSINTNQSTSKFCELGAL